MDFPWDEVKEILEKCSIINVEDEKNYLCGICGKIVIQATQIECGCIFCHECIAKYLLDGGLYCPATLTDDCSSIRLCGMNDTHEEKECNKMVLALRVNCPTQDCDHEADLKSMVIHYRECKKNTITEVSVSKSLLCSNNECFVVNDSLVTDFSETVSTACRNNESSVVNDSSVTDVFVAESLLCRNKESLDANDSLQNCDYDGDSEIRNDKDSFAKISLEGVSIDNQYKKPQDVEDLIIMINSLKRKNKKLEKVVVELKDRIDYLESDYLNINGDSVLNALEQLEKCIEERQYEPFVWAIGNFSEHRENKTCLLSESFCAFKNGYKMRLMLYPGGAYSNEYVSVYFEIIRSEFDSLLEWPFCYNVSFSILNQEKGDHHIHTVFYLHHKYRHYVYGRPMDSANVGLGASEFIKYSDLVSADGLLMNDVILLRCSVTKSPSSMAWKD